MHLLDLGSKWAHVFEVLLVKKIGCAFQIRALYLKFKKQKAAFLIIMDKFEVAANM